MEQEIYTSLDVLVKMRDLGKKPDQPITRPKLCDFIRSIEKLLKASPANFDDIGRIMQNWANDRGYVFAFDGFDDQNRMLKARILSKKA